MCVFQFRELEVCLSPYLGSHLLEFLANRSSIYFVRLTHVSLFLVQIYTNVLIYPKKRVNSLTSSRIFCQDSRDLSHR